MNDLIKVSKGVKNWGWVVFISGLLALLSPLLAGAFVTIIVGAVMLIAGVTRVIHTGDIVETPGSRKLSR